MTYEVICPLVYKKNLQDVFNVVDRALCGVSVKHRRCFYLLCGLACGYGCFMNLKQRFFPTDLVFCAMKSADASLSHERMTRGLQKQ